MAVNVGKIAEALRGGAPFAEGWPAMRRIFKGAGLSGFKTEREGRRAAAWATRAAAGAIVGGAVGGAWGAISDRESILGGAMKGAFVGGAIRVGARVGMGALPMSRFGNYRAASTMSIPSKSGYLLSKIARLNNTRNFRSNIQNTWNLMSGRPGLRNTIIGAGALGAVRGMFGGEDNPIGGAGGGAVAGTIQGAALYGAYRGLKRVKGTFKVK